MAFDGTQWMGRTGTIPSKFWWGVKHCSSRPLTGQAMEIWGRPLDGEPVSAVHLTLACTVQALPRAPLSHKMRPPPPTSWSASRQVGDLRDTWTMKRTKTTAPSHQGFGNS